MNSLIIPWNKVWKKATTWINGAIAVMALLYPMLSEQMKSDMGTWFVSVFALAAALNVYLGNKKQHNLPPPLEERG